MFYKFYLVLFFINVFSELHSQNKIITLQSNGATRKISLKHSHELKLLTSRICDLDKGGKQEFIGIGLSIDSGRIILKPLSQLVEYTDPSKSEFKKTIYTESSMPVTFSLDNILAIDYRSNATKQIQNTGYWILTAGLFTTLILAPLISLKKNSEFNTHRYYSTVGLGLMTIGISIPIIILTKHKSYALSNYDYKERRIWKYVEQ